MSVCPWMKSLFCPESDAYKTGMRLWVPHWGKKMWFCNNHYKNAAAEKQSAEHGAKWSGVGACETITLSEALFWCHGNRDIVPSSLSVYIICSVLYVYCSIKLYIKGWLTVWASENHSVLCCVYFPAKTCFFQPRNIRNNKQPIIEFWLPPIMT